MPIEGTVSGVRECSEHGGEVMWVACVHFGRPEVGVHVHATLVSEDWPFRGYLLCDDCYGRAEPPPKHLLKMHCRLCLVRACEQAIERMRQVVGALNQRVERQ